MNQPTNYSAPADAEPESAAKATYRNHIQPLLEKLDALAEVQGFGFIAVFDLGESYCIHPGAPDKDRLPIEAPLIDVICERGLETLRESAADAKEMVKQELKCRRPFSQSNDTCQAVNEILNEVYEQGQAHQIPGVVIVEIGYEVSGNTYRCQRMLKAIDVTSMDLGEVFATLATRGPADFLDLLAAQKHDEAGETPVPANETVH